MRDGKLRAIHPAKYIFRSDDVKSTAMIRAAFLSPESFDRGLVRAHMFPVRPASRTDWEGLLVVSFPVPVPGADEPPAVRDFGAVLSSGSRVIHRFARRATLSPVAGSDREQRTLTFIEPVTLEPGDYSLSVVMRDPATMEPDSVQIDVEVPEIPRKELFVLDPLLGRPAAGNLVVRGGEDGEPGSDRVGGRASFEPLLVQRVETGEDLVAISRTCLVGKRVKAGPVDGATVQRRLLADDGKPVGSLPDVPLSLDGDGSVRCQELVDVLPGDAILPGAYEFEVGLAGAGETPAVRTRFAATGD